MPQINLKNITINERQTLTGESYYIIFDNDNNQAYFCFQNKVKNGWDELQNINERSTNSFSQKGLEIEIEFEEHEKGNKVISLSANQTGEFIF